MPGSVVTEGPSAANGADLVRIPVRVLKINDAILWGSPVELFCEIALHVHAAPGGPRLDLSEARAAVLLSDTEDRLFYRAATPADRW